ncbi:MAG: TIGR00269 family protein [Nanoarchaeota archaeon]
MRCSCGFPAVYEGICKMHFLEHVCTTVENTIKKYSLFTKGDRILVAISGGKDSQVLLAILHRLGYDPDALLVDEGICGYREHTVKDTKELCATLSIPLRIVTFQEEMGDSLDSILKKRRKRNPCTICGAYRRTLLNRYAEGYDVIATGHNLDDEAQVILMNILSHNIKMLPRIGPRSGTQMHVGFVPRVKPLYHLTEKEIRLFAYLNKLHISPKECPYVPESFRGYIRTWLNSFEHQHPGAKKNIVDWYLSHAAEFEKRFAHETGIRICRRCGQPSSNLFCKTCSLQQH